MCASTYTRQMRKTTLLDKTKRWLLRFLQVQLFITAVSFPILASWGLPISLVSPLGNLIFFPILFLFLLFSSFIFFLELIHLPNGFLIFCLEKLTDAWSAVLSLGNGTGFLIGFRQPPKLLLLAIPCCAFFIISNRYTKQTMRSIVLLTVLLFATFGYLKLFWPPEPCIKQIECNGGTVVVAQSNGETVVIDPGVIGRKPSATSWVQYTLAPDITTTTGKHAIDYLILLQPGVRTFNAAETLCKTMSIGTIFIVEWEGSLKKNGWRSYFHLKRAAQQNGTQIARVGRKKLKLVLGKEDHVTIKPLQDRLHYHDATYPALHVTGQIDNKSFHLYAAGYKGERQKIV